MTHEDGLRVADMLSGGKVFTEDVLLIRGIESRVLGRMAPDGTVYVTDPDTNEERSATWEEAVAIFVRVARELRWHPVSDGSQRDDA